MMKPVFTLFTVLLTSFSFASPYDSIAWFDETHLSFARVTTYASSTDYVFYPNGHVATITCRQGNRLAWQKEYYENGNKKFDTVCVENYYNWSNRYYPDGSKQRFIQEQFESSYKSSHTKFEIIDWDEQGEVSHIFFKDDKNNVVANEAYPFRKFRNMQWEQTWYEDGPIKESGLWVMDSLSGKKKKMGAWVSFYHNGQTASVGLFINDVPWGLHYTFDSTGVQTSLTNYVLGKETSMEQDDLTLKTSTWKDGPLPYWQWRDFTSEGLIHYADGKGVYYYRGTPLVTISDLYKLRKENPAHCSFTLPYMAFWSTWNKYTVTYRGSIIEREMEDINGSWHNTRTYSMRGQIIESSIGSRNEHCTWFDNGKMSVLEKPIYYSYYVPQYFSIAQPKGDTTFLWNSSGDLATMQIHGLYGQLRKTIYRRKNKPDSIAENTQFKHVYINPDENYTGKQRRIEILDNEVMLPGYIRIVDEKGNTIEKGWRNIRNEGVWFTYDPVTGQEILRETWSDGKGKGPGLYFEHYSDGNPKLKGHYNKDGKEIRVWKTYGPKGNVTHRVRYKDGKVKGIEICKQCCKNKYGRYRMRVTLHFGKRQFSFPRCQPSYDIFD